MRHTNDTINCSPGVYRLIVFFALFAIYIVRSVGGNDYSFSYNSY